MQAGEIKTRKVRSDKKIPIAPYIHDDHRVRLHRISQFMGRIPEGIIGVLLVTAAINDDETIRHFARYFKRSFHFTPEMYFPGRDSEALDAYSLIDTSTFNRARYKMKFNQVIHKQLVEFQIALGISYSAHAAKLLLEFSLNNLHMIRKIAPAIKLEDYMTDPRPTQQYPRSPHNVWSILNK